MAAGWRELNQISGWGGCSRGAQLISTRSALAFPIPSSTVFFLGSRLWSLLERDFRPRGLGPTPKGYCSGVVHLLSKLPAPRRLPARGRQTSTLRSWGGGGVREGNRYSPPPARTHTGARRAGLGEQTRPPCQHLPGHYQPTSWGNRSEADLPQATQLRRGADKGLFPEPETTAPGPLVLGQRSANQRVPVRRGGGGRAGQSEGPCQKAEPANRVSGEERRKRNDRILSMGGAP